ncbi:MAG: urate hydroxylase PuuD, partial [Caulobacterales bacterium]
AVSGHIAPEALFWFRWAALATVITGLLVAASRGYILSALTLGASNGFVSAGDTFIGIGMWLALIMAFNVWFVIWPNQQKALNIANAYPDLSAEAKAAAGRTAMLFSRTNTLLSIPMLVCMAGRQTMWG